MLRRSAKARRILDDDDSEDDGGHRGARGGGTIPSRPHAVSGSRVAVHPAPASRAFSGLVPSSATLSSDSESELEQWPSFGKLPTAVSPKASRLSPANRSVQHRLPASGSPAFHLDQARFRASLDSSSDNEEDEKESLPSSIDENWYLAESFGQKDVHRAPQKEPKASSHVGMGAGRAAMTAPHSPPRTVDTPPRSPPKGAAKMIFVVTYPSLKVPNLCLAAVSSWG